jgi:hypothetical protein
MLGLAAQKLIALPIQLSHALRASTLTTNPRVTQKAASYRENHYPTELSHDMICDVTIQIGNGHFKVVGNA